MPRYSREQRGEMKTRQPALASSTSTTQMDNTPILTTQTDDRTLFFWKPNELEHGCFCQWYMSPFRDPAIHPEHIFNCAEQYMMYRKALILALPATYSSNQTNQPKQARQSHAANQAVRLPSMILSEKDPRKQKSLARSVRFTPEQLSQWEKVKFDVVVQGNYCKFGQNPDLLQKLLATGDSELVEASPHDNIWGIGLAAESAEAHREQWGKNLLGKALMAARTRLRAESHEPGEHTAQSAT